MDTKKILYTLLLALFGLSFSACDDESAFEGGDNHLAAFTLLQDGKQYAGVISEGQIVITIPDTLKLNNVTVQYACSEHASLSPDPASIENWEQPQTFTVTSYNGQSQTYRYTLKRSAVTLEEGVNLRNDAEIAAFAEKQVSRIEGSLIIGMKEAFSKEDSITTLAPLASLKEVTGNIKIYASFNGTSLEGLENLEHVGGIELIYPENNNNSRPDFKNLRRIELNALTVVDSDLKLIADTLDIFSFPQLTTVGRHVWIEGNGIRALQAPKLHTVGGDFLLGSARWYGNWQFEYLEEVNLPELTTVAGNFSIKRTESVKKCLLPKLTSTSGFSLSTSQLEELNVSQLSEVIGTLSITSMPLLELNLSQLKKVDALQFQSLSALKKLNIPIQEISGRLQIYNLPLLETLTLSELTKVGGELQIQSCPMLKDLSSLGKLEKVGGKFTLSGLDEVKNADGFHSLTTIGGDFSLAVNNGASFDFSGFNALVTVGGGFSLFGDGMQTTLNAFNNLKSIGNSFQLQGLTTVTSLEGFDALTSCGTNVYCTISDLPNITNLSHFLGKLKGSTVSTLNISAMPQLNHLDVSGITIASLYLTGIQLPLILKGDASSSMTVNHQNSNKLTLDGIEELGTLSISNSLKDVTSMCFDGLKRIKGQLQIFLPANAPNMEYISFPDLETVSNNLSIAGNFPAVISVELPKLKECASLTYYGMASMSIPELTKVSGQLSISTAYASGQNVIMMGADDIHLPKLKSVGTLIITTNTYNVSQYNTTLTNLDFLSGLEYVTSTNANAVQVNRQSALTDFTGLKNVVEGLTQASQWNVNYNGYNPTFEEAKAGKLK